MGKTRLRDVCFKLMRILALVTDAFGGHGGIAKFNRDLLTALCNAPDVEQVIAVPRLMPEVPGDLPAKLQFVTEALGGKFRYTLAALKSAIRNRQSKIILCGHINLLPVAFAVRLICRAPVILVIHGIDAWQPTRSGLVNHLVRKVNGFIAVSDFTRNRFLSWAQLKGTASFVLPNCVNLVELTAGPKDGELIKEYALYGRTVLLTVARLSAEERYKGVDEVLEVLPDLAKKFQLSLILSSATVMIVIGSNRKPFNSVCAIALFLPDAWLPPTRLVTTGWRTHS
jgi:phosphatidylinositol alpha-1,6-mannosyltransferase